MKSPVKDSPRPAGASPKRRGTAASARKPAEFFASPLGRTARERVFLDFEQTLICASEAFYRFAGAIMGPTAKEHKLTGQENVILQQIMFSSQARSASELCRFANRDDVANIQYSLRKLVGAGLIEKMPGTNPRDTRYQPTAAGRAVTDAMVERRRELLIGPSAGFHDLEAQLHAAALSLSLLTGLYDHVARVLAGRH